MKKVATLAVLAFAFGMVAYASEKVAALDGTSWKVDVVPDTMAKSKGEKDYKEVLTFADGAVSMTEGQKTGFASSPYEVTRSGEKNYTFKAEQTSESMGQSTWTGSIHEKSLSGKLILTRKDGAVFTYTIKGSQLD